MTTSGNCLDSGSAFSENISNNYLIIFGYEFVVTTPQKVTTITWRRWGDGFTYWRPVIYKKNDSNIENDTIVYEHPTTITSTSIGLLSATGLEVNLNAGTYHIGIHICSITGSSRYVTSREDNDNPCALHLKTATCGSAPSPLGEVNTRPVHDWYICVTHEDNAAQLTVQSSPFTEGVVFTLDSVGKATKYVETITKGTKALVMPSSVILTHKIQSSIGGSVVANVKHSYAIRWARKCFYAAGRFWVFYVYKPEGTAFMYYTSSTDGSTWETPVQLIQVNYEYAETMNIWFDGTYVHANYKRTTKLYVRVGIPQSDGTISWLANWQTMLENNELTHTDHSYCIESNGIPHCSWHAGSNVADLDTWHSKSNHDIRTDGVWTDASGMPEEVISSTNYSGSLILPLGNNTMLMILCRTGNPLKAIYFNGSSWGSVETATSKNICEQYATGFESWAYSAVVDEHGDVHLVYLASDYTINYVKRTYSTGLWSTSDEQELFAGTHTEHDPVICLDESSQDIIVFASHCPTDDKIAYKRFYHDGSFSDTWTEIVDETVAGLADNSGTGGTGGLVICFRRTWGNYIGLMYIVNGAGSTFDIKFKALSLKTLTETYDWQKWEDESTNRTRNYELLSDVELTAYFTYGIPTVTTSAGSNITQTTATLNGNITNDNGDTVIERGFDIGKSSGVYDSSTTETGNFSTGSYSLSIDGLEAGQLYYVRAKARNSGGWGYGSEVMITMLDPTRVTEAKCIFKTVRRCHECSGDMFPAPREDLDGQKWIEWICDYCGYRFRDEINPDEENSTFL